MRAACIRGYGPPDVFSIEEVDRPSPRKHDLLIEVHASSVNPIDTKIRSGAQRAIIHLAFPATLGLDVSGVVVEVGREVRDFAVGDEVFSSPTHTRPGTYAEYVAVDQRMCAKKPSNLTHPEAASIPLVGLTAWECLVNKGHLERGQKVFIQAGAGGVGSFAIQLAKHLGAQVATTCSERNVELVRSLGADVVVDYTKEAFDDVLRDYDVVLDSLGGDFVERGFKVLRRGGRMVNIEAGVGRYTERYGAYPGIVLVGLNILRMGLTARFWGVRATHAFRPSDGKILTSIAGLLEEEKVRPLIDRTFSLEEIAASHEYSESGRTRGKSVIVVRD